VSKETYTRIEAAINVNHFHLLSIYVLIYPALLNGIRIQPSADTSVKRDLH
jgi:hypothetical protein